MDISLKITNLYKQKLMTLQDLADKIGMTKTGLHNALKSNDFKVSVLQKIAIALNVDISYFFMTNNTFLSSYKEMEIQLNALEKDNNVLEARLIIYEQFLDNLETSRENLVNFIENNTNYLNNLKKVSKENYNFIILLLRKNNLRIKENIVYDNFGKNIKKIKNINSKLTRPPKLVELS